jgi:tRNA(fMet)-specific endonuclease VapC
VYLWDANILRHFAEGQSILFSHLNRIRRADVALPSVVVAEVLRGRCDYALKATSDQAASAHALLIATYRMLGQFQIVVFDRSSADAMTHLQKRHSSRKRYADVQIAAMALAGNHIVVTRNTKDFSDLLRPDQIENWIDFPPQ